ncbi:hypothetical protein C8Q76DRAFT_725392 [Earliella scabrosa]|nr:hypothetical protein C8Q76DRAFT_725392 [Earliella scabrosa]
MRSVIALILIFFLAGTTGLPVAQTSAPDRGMLWRGCAHQRIAGMSSAKSLPRCAVSDVPQVGRIPDASPNRRSECG